MEKIEIIYPESFKIMGGKVVIDESVFMDLLKTLNKQTRNVNALVEENETLKQNISKLTTDVQNIAKAVSLIMED